MRAFGQMTSGLKQHKDGMLFQGNHEKSEIWGSVALYILASTLNALLHLLIILVCSCLRGSTLHASLTKLVETVTPLTMLNGKSKQDFLVHAYNLGGGGSVRSLRSVFATCVPEVLF